MKRKIYYFILFFLPISAAVNAQMTPQEAVKAMQRGINIGNTMEPPTEGAWGNPAIKKRAFSDYKNAGFTAIRIPITWDGHTLKTSPYTITKSWLDRVDTVVKWGLEQKLFIIINVHHDSWIKNSYTPENKARLDSIWSQVATRFKDRNDSLLFEIINEPEPLAQANVNDLNKRILSIIRKTNSTRNVVFSGHRWSNADELVTAAIPDANDKHLIGYYHSYDPHPFGLEGPGTYGSDADIKATRDKFIKVANWSKTTGIPVILGEFGYRDICEYNSRMCAYATVSDLAQEYGVATFAWDDGGWFPMYNRNTFQFNEIKDILIHTYKESPNRTTISNYADTLIQLRWNNRTTEIDSFIVERKIGTGQYQTFAKVPTSSSRFIDSSVVTGITYYYRLKANLKDSIELQSQPVTLNNAKVTRIAYNGTSYSIPGTIEAENFDKGMEGISYHDSDVENKGDAYRLGEGVDIAKASTTVYLSFLETGEWQEYTVNVKNAGYYKIEAYVAAAASGGKFSIVFNGGTEIIFNVAATESATTFSKVDNTVYLDAGIQVMRVKIINPEFNINKYVFTVSTAVSKGEQESFELYPNPATSSVEIKGAKANSSAQFFDITGKKVKSVNLDSNFKINIEDLDNGIYILKYSDYSGTYIEKLVKK